MDITIFHTELMSLQVEIASHHDCKRVEGIIGKTFRHFQRKLAESVPLVNFAMVKPYGESILPL